MTVVGQSSAASAAPRSRRRTLVFGVVSLAIGLMVSLVCAELALRYQRERVELSDFLEPGMILYDPLLGWRLAANWHGSHRHYDFAVEYAINRFGYRGEPERTANGRVYAVVGDSFTFGLGVDEGQSFVHLLNAMDTDGNLFLNFGIPGYSTDQEYLLIESRVALFDPDEILLMVYLGNDLFDNQRPFPLQAEHAKPYFKLDANSRLVLNNSPVPRRQQPAAARERELARILLGDDAPAALGRPLGALGNVELIRRLGLLLPPPGVPEEVLRQHLGPAVELFLALTEAIRRSAVAHGAQLTVALLPGCSYVERPGSLSAQIQEYLRKQCMDGLESVAGVRVIDLATRLRAGATGVDPDWYYPHEGHLTPEGNRVVAQWLDSSLFLAMDQKPVAQVRHQ